MPGPTYSRTRQTSEQKIRHALEGALPKPFWLDQEGKPTTLDPLQEHTQADLVVIGGGYSGLWTALLAKEADPSLSVVLLEGRQVGWAASGRNGGFVESTLTHGKANGERHFPSELGTLNRLGQENFDEFVTTIKRYSIDAELEQPGMLTVATDQYHLADFQEGGPDEQMYDQESISQLVNSPVFLAGRLEHRGVALVNPAKLAWGLQRVCLDLGVRIFENSPALQVRDQGKTVHVRTKRGSVTAKRAALATNAFPSLLKRNALLTIPVYDYVLMTEPLSDEQLKATGWLDRFGITDSSRQFHYYRKTRDNRILFGGYDAIYHKGGHIRGEYEQRQETFELLADHFFTTFPQLDVNFTHAWGGAIDMCTRLTAFQGRAYGGKVAYSAGFTGLGVASTRFGAKVMLDLLSGADTELTRLKLVRTKPLPVPPEPLAYPLIQTMRRAIEKSDANNGKDGLLIKAVETFGIGFDS
ncbi:NAD(P)/FAD-dependent oxidoreductase [Paenarthrobacter nitroguajacolicus]|uniref:NAD(P)/FAD-dependent oxidoreductase n=1 Tax=Paenarthrobacter nitroguajacolicus TaxID=211146 RepID=UPI00343666DB